MNIKINLPLNFWTGISLLENGDKLLNPYFNFTKARDPPSFLEDDGQICIYPFDKAEILNTHFSNIANIDNESDLSYNVTPPSYQLNEFIITEQEVLDQLNILNINKPGGPDGISPRLLKNIAYSISKPLTKFVNMSFN